MAVSAAPLEALGHKRSHDVLVHLLTLRPLLVGGDRRHTVKLAAVDAQREQLVVELALELERDGYAFLGPGVR